VRIVNFRHTDVTKEGIRHDGVKVPVKASVGVFKPNPKKKEDNGKEYQILITEDIRNGDVPGVALCFENEKEFDKFVNDLVKKA